MTRIIMIHSAETFRVKIFDHRPTQVERARELVDGLKLLTKAHGEAIFQPDVRDAIETWNAAGCPPEPEHSRLANYSTRRILHVLRLSLISAASSGHPYHITLVDFHRALDWLVEAEQTMPDVFKEMVQRSDSQVIAELHMYVWQTFNKDKKPVHEARLLHFLQTKVPVEKIQRLIAIAVGSNMLDQIENPNGRPFYRPRPRSDHGMEH